jgi:hypothetical protein
LHPQVAKDFKSSGSAFPLRYTRPKFGSQEEICTPKDISF